MAISVHRLLPILLLPILALIGSFAPCPPALAWGELGHRVVGELAEQRLSEHARVGVAELLREEPDPSLAGVSTWADAVRDQAAWRHTGRWHYVNLPDLDCDYRAERDCPDGACIVAAITEQATVLADATAARADRVAALKFLVHLVGDVHQPMHAGLRSDRGGNDYQINHRGEGSNLHRVWDDAILRDGEPDWYGLAERLRREPPAPDTLPDAPMADAPLTWALESCHAIRAHRLYPEDGGHVVDDAYFERLRPLAETRLRLAGERLARLLEHALAP